MRGDFFGRLLVALVTNAVSVTTLTAFDCDEPTPVKPLRLDTVAPCEVNIIKLPPISRLDLTQLSSTLSQR